MLGETQMPWRHFCNMSTNYGANSAMAPGAAGGVSFGPWTGAHLAPNADLHNASIGTTATLRDPALASRTTGAIPNGPLVSQTGTSNNSSLPKSVQDAMQNLSPANLQLQSLLSRILGGFQPQQQQQSGGGANMTPWEYKARDQKAQLDYITRDAQQKQVAQQNYSATQAWNDRFNNAKVQSVDPFNPSYYQKQLYNQPRPTPVPSLYSTPSGPGQQPININANIALPQY